MLAAIVRASPVDNWLVCSIAARVMLSTCRGICLTSRSAREAVTTTAAATDPTSRRSGTSSA